MGEVWLAEHALIGRRVAIKLLKPGLAVSDEMVSRFFNEARAAAAIADPGIVQIFDFGYHTDGSAYIVMELLEGETLDQHLGVMSLADALLVMRQVASALGAAHARNIIHRDIKPENLFLVRDPEVPGGRRAKILDFGIAKLNGDPSAQLTHTQALIGTPLYMSPEQCRGAGQVDQRTDIYSLGCVMFELIVGEPPFTGEGVGDVIAKHLREPAPRVDGVPTDVADLIARCLAKDPRERFATGGDLAPAIGALLSRGVGLAPRMAPSSPALAMTAPPSAMLPAVRSSTAMAAVRGSSTLPAVRPSSTLATPPPPARPSARPMTPPPTQAQPVFAASGNALPVFSATAAPVFEPRANTTLSNSVVVTETPPAGTGIDKRVVGALAGVAVAVAAIAFFVVHSSSPSPSASPTPTPSPSTATVAAAAPIAPAPRPAVPAPAPGDRLTGRRDRFPAVGQRSPRRRLPERPRSRAARRRRAPRCVGPRRRDHLHRSARWPGRRHRVGRSRRRVRHRRRSRVVEARGRRDGAARAALGGGRGQAGRPQRNPGRRGQATGTGTATCIGARRRAEATGQARSLVRRHRPRRRRHPHLPMMMRSLLCVAALAAVAHADGTTARAESLFKEGRRLMAAGKIAEACATFDASQKIDPATTTVLNQADCREKNAQLATAWSLFLEAERQTRASTDDVGKKMHGVATDRAAKLEGQVSHLTINVGKLVPGLVIQRGTDVLDPGEFGRAMPIDGGTYTIVARRQPQPAVVDPPRP